MSRPRRSRRLDDDQRPRAMCRHTSRALGFALHEFTLGDGRVELAAMDECPMDEGCARCNHV